jgi:hypothetical protein
MSFLHLFQLAVIINLKCIHNVNIYSFLKDIAISCICVRLVCHTEISILIESD